MLEPSAHVTRLWSDGLGVIGIGEEGLEDTLVAFLEGCMVSTSQVE